MSHKKHHVQCFTCGHALADGQEVGYFAQYATKVNPEEAPFNVLEEISHLLDYMIPIASTLGAGTTKTIHLLSNRDVSEFGWLLWHLSKEAKRRVRWVIDELEARDEEQDGDAPEQNGKEG